MQNNQKWKIWIDTGGTFTDCLAVAPDGKGAVFKVLSNSALRGNVIKKIDSTKFVVNQSWAAPDDFITGFRFQLLSHAHAAVEVGHFDARNSIIELEKSLPVRYPENAAFEVKSSEEVPVLAARLATGTPVGQPLPALEMRLGTTRGTNALLERKGAPLAFFVTKGFKDILQIGNQARPDLFALNIIKPKPLYTCVVEIDARLNAQGEVIKPLEIQGLRQAVEQLKSSGIRTAAIALMHSYLNPDHEQVLQNFLLQNGFNYVVTSSELAPLIRYLPRAETTVVDACIGPIIRDYISKVLSALPEHSLHVMTSAGGLVRATNYRAKDSLFSGPAGGVVGAARSAKAAGFDKIIGFDMGGTSTDVCRFDGDYEYRFEQTIGDAHLLAPALAIETVAAGGGSICSFDGFQMHVGPESASAFPGPACYGAGGPLTITDCNLLLGRLSPERFGIPIDVKAAELAASGIQKHVKKATGAAISVDKLAAGFLEIANERMADVIRKISTRKGYAPAEFAMVAFGGAGAQNACAVADKLDIRTVIVPENASLLSAFGIGHAAIERFAEKQVLRPLAEVEAIEVLIAELNADAVEKFAEEHIDLAELVMRRCIVSLRIVGQNFSLPIDWEKGIDLQAAFIASYQQIYGHAPEQPVIEIESIRVIISTKVSEEMHRFQSKKTVFLFDERATQRAFFNGEWQQIRCLERDQMRAKDEISGPALILENHSTIVVANGWNAQLNGSGAVILQRNT